MKIVVAGGSGQVGTILREAFHRDGHEVVVLSRNSSESVRWRTVVWDGRSQGNWCEEVNGAEAVINLAGRSVNCRYGARNRREIMASRVDSTKALGVALAMVKNPPAVWLQASTATIYEHRFDAPNDEVTGVLGGSEPDAPDTWRFSIDVAKAWERSAFESPAAAVTRLVLLRSAIIMSPGRGGAFDMLLRLVRIGLGGRHGDGRQYVSWIHAADFVRAIYGLLGLGMPKEEAGALARGSSLPAGNLAALAGPVNLASPEPLPNAEFMRILRQTWGLPVGAPALPWMLEIGAFFLRTETELLLKSRRVAPRRLIEAGFQFDFPCWRGAAADLCAQWRRERHGASSDAGQ